MITIACLCSIKGILAGIIVAILLAWFVTRNASSDDDTWGM